MSKKRTHGNLEWPDLFILHPWACTDITRMPGSNPCQLASDHSSALTGTGVAASEPLGVPCQNLTCQGSRQRHYRLEPFSWLLNLMIFFFTPPNCFISTFLTPFFYSAFLLMLLVYLSSLHPDGLLVIVLDTGKTMIKDAWFLRRS